MIRIPGKIPIAIHPLFWLIAFFIGWLWTTTLVGALFSVVVIVMSVLFHEYGHALTAIAFGQSTRIELAAFGGFTYRTGRKLKLWEEFLVVLNGPLAGLTLCGAAFLILHYAPPTQPLLLFTVRFTFLANLFWTIINLIPVLPLDGGHLMSILLESIFGFKGVKMAILIGLVVAIAISIFFFVVGQFLIGALFLILTFESFRSLRYYKIFNEQDRDQDLQKLLKEADRYQEAGNFARALETYESVRQRAGKGILTTMATQEMASIYKEEKQYEKGYELLMSIRKDVSQNFLPLLHFLAFVNGDLTTTLQVGNQCYQTNPSYDTALINACANGKLANVEAAVGWLECCVRDEIPSITEAMARAEFDPIRDEKQFIAFQAKMS